jgi:hypothetical protein
MNDDTNAAARVTLENVDTRELDDAECEAMTRGHCPACNGRGFILGPQGGAATNLECANLECRARFNVVNLSGQIIMAQTIPRESEGGIAWPVLPFDNRRTHSGTFS